MRSNACEEQERTAAETHDVELRCAWRKSRDQQQRRDRQLLWKPYISLLVVDFDNYHNGAFV